MLPNCRLGKRVLKAPGGALHSGPPALVEQLELQLGQETVQCSAQVVGKSLLRQSPAPSVCLSKSIAPSWVGQRQSLSAPANTDEAPQPPRCSRYPPASRAWAGVGREGQELTGQQRPQMVPADVESPELCLGLQTLLSLQVRRCSHWYHTVA